MPVDNEVYMGDDEMVVYRYDSEVVDKETGRMHSSSRVVVIEDCVIGEAFRFGWQAGRGCACKRQV
jgi:hypothetical protein